MTKDLEFGLSNEEILFDKLKVFDNTIKKTNKMCFCDYEGENTLIELKTRRNTKDKYPTTMIGLNKITKFLKSNKKGYCVFNFTDGIYYYEVDNETLKKCNTGRGGRNDRGRAEYKDYCFIPIELLNPIPIQKSHI